MLEPILSSAVAPAGILPDMSYYISDTISINSDPYIPSYIPSGLATSSSCQHWPRIAQTRPSTFRCPPAVWRTRATGFAPDICQSHCDFRPIGLSSTFPGSVADVSVKQIGDVFAGESRRLLDFVKDLGFFGSASAEVFLSLHCDIF